MDAEQHQELERRLAEHDRGLELDGAGLRELVGQALPHLERYVDSLPEQPAWDAGAVSPPPSVEGPMPELGRPAPELFEELFEQLVPRGFNTASPGYLAFVPGGGLLHAAVAELVANAVNRFVGVAAASPGWARLEGRVVRWLCELCGYGPRSGGYLATGGSMANLSALVAARVKHLGEELGGGVLYVSEHTHHSIAKAARVAGLSASAVRTLGCDSRLRLDLGELAESVARDRRDGLRPFLVVGSAGTTNTGAVDPLAGLAELCAREELWLHVDAAYGGAFLLTERGRACFAGIERADSVTLDPHKGLFLPYGTGALLCRERADLHRAHSGTADYMPPLSADGELPDFAELSPELSRDFRGLRLWLPLCMHGAGTFRRYLDEKLDLARWLAHELAALPGLELLCEPELSLFAFRWAPEGLGEEQRDRLNERLLERINAPQRVFLTPTRVDDRFVLRVCVLSFRTHLERVRECLEAVRFAMWELAPEAGLSRPASPPERA